MASRVFRGIHNGGQTIFIPILSICEKIFILLLNLVFLKKITRMKLKLMKT